MSDQTQPTADDLGQVLDCERLRDWMVGQRWYAAKARGISGVEVVERAALRSDLLLLLVQTRFATGTHELYQLLVVAEAPGAEPAGAQVIARNADVALLDAIAEPRRALALLEKILEDAEVRTEEGCFAFRHVEGAYRPGEEVAVRAMGVEQSNSSIVFDERSVLKLFRKVESGINPELELLRFLTAVDFQHIAPLHGWYEYEGPSLASTLGIAQEFIPGARDGWELVLDEIPAAPDGLLERLERLGTITGEMHTALGSVGSDPAFCPEEPSNEALSLLTASIDEDIERIFLRLPDAAAVAPIFGRGEDVRAKLASRSQIGIGGRHIRIHGDYHLGQTLDTERGWVILDFEGEPARPLPERRQKRSPLRDVAGMLRSFAYATSAVALQRGQSAPPDFEQRAREAFLGGYLGAVDPALLPPGEAAINNLLAIFELEKAVYELRYELNHRPDWVAIPVAGIRRLLEEE